MQSFLLQKTYVCRSDLEEKIGVYLKYHKPYACGFTFEPSWDQQHTLKNLPPLSSKKIQLTTKIATEPDTMPPPSRCPPAVRIQKVNAIVVRCAIDLDLRNRVI